MKINKEELMKKLDYFWYYYKWYVIGGLAFLIVAGSMAKDIVTQKDYVMSAMMLNCTSDELDEFTQEYTDSIGIDQKKEAVSLSTAYLDPADASSTYYTFQALQVRISGHAMDVLVLDTETAENYLRDYVEDLNDVLSEEDLEYFKDRLVNYDADRGDYVLSQDTSAMGDPVPVAIMLGKDTKLTKFMAGGKDFIFEFCVNSVNRERAIEFLYYIFEQ